MIGKPLFGLNSPGYWSYLEDNGFRLYHNLFDYSLDSVTDFNQRVILHIKQLRKVLAMPLDEVEKILLTHKDDIEYNKNLARTFVDRDTSYLNHIHEMQYIICLVTRRSKRSKPINTFIILGENYG